MKRAADRVERVIGGERVREIRFAFDHLRQHEDTLRDRCVARVATRGKALLVHFEHGWSIYTHNQLYGRWYLKKPGQRPLTGRQLRLAIETDRGAALLYSASDIEVWPTDELHRQPFLSRVGPDLLSDDVSAADVLDRLRDERFRRRQLAGILLDQGFLAGLGNYLRADILFAAGVHPTARSVDLDAAGQERLAGEILRIIRRAYRTAGVTNDAERVARLKREGLRRSAFRHLVYGRAGQPCWVCGELIERRDIGGRKLYFCPNCQRAGARERA